LSLSFLKKPGYFFLVVVLLTTGCMNITASSHTTEEELSLVAFALTANSQGGAVESPITTQAPPGAPEVPAEEIQPTSTVTLAPGLVGILHTPTPKICDSPSKLLPNVCEETGKYYFGDYYVELPRSSYINQLIIPDTIILHTDGQSGDRPEAWNTMTTYWGLGYDKSVHFAVSQDGVLQMLPMYTATVMHGIGVEPGTTAEGIYANYNTHSIQIEMAGRNYDLIVTGHANPVMEEVVEVTTQKTIDLVVTLMAFYDIPIDNVLGHYQINAGNRDPGSLYFEQYFLPRLIEAWNSRK
jgi:hypothetical protein